MTREQLKANELKAQFGSNAKYVVCEIVDALKITTGHLTIKRLLERQELQDDFDYWKQVKNHIEESTSLVSAPIKPMCGKHGCYEPVYEWGLCFKHHCYVDHQ